MTTQNDDNEESRDRTPYIAIKISLPHHHKIMKLRKLLGLNGRHEAVGVLVDFWIQVYIHAWKTGNMGAWNDEDIEDMVGWKGEPGLFIRALKDCGFVDPGPGIIVHDWLNVQKMSIRNRLRSAEYRQKTSGRPAPLDDTDKLVANTARLDALHKK